MALSRGGVRAEARRRIGDSSTTPDYGDDLINNLIERRQHSIQAIISNYQSSFYTERVSYTGEDPILDWTGEATAVGNIRDDLGVASRNEIYALPTNFKTFVKLYRRYGTASTSARAEVPLVNPEDHELQRFNNIGFPFDSAGEGPNYQTCSLVQEGIRILPPVTSNDFHYDLYYIRTPNAMFNDSSYMDMPDSAMDWLIYDVCANILLTVGDPLAGQFLQMAENDKQNWIQNETRNRAKSVQPIDSVLFW